ncbi:DUF6325 family protein [Ilumatobacter nonamiensis]|uniref:DUF6325 family protein n=1 Tax=Ilumatobacter nonamiensis TaxID=467093 RepID=UPI001566D1DD|nr:DUF6325 family protein [Ilumatobacter nonamiensis]
MSDEDVTMGPISYLIVEFPENKMTGEGLQSLIDLVDQGIIRILDLEFVTRRDDGSVAALSLHEIDGGDFDLSVFEGASSGMLDQSDLDDARDSIAIGASAGILIFENRWAADFVTGMRNGGGQLVAAGYIPLTDVLDSLDATESV